MYRYIINQFLLVFVMEMPGLQITLILISCLWMVYALGWLQGFSNPIPAALARD